jgi:hypothetical protein
MEKDIYWWDRDLGPPNLRVGGLESNEQRASNLTTELLCRDAWRGKRIGPLNEAEWARHNAKWTTAEFERLQDFLASPVCQQIEQDLVDTQHLIVWFDERTLQTDRNKVNQFFGE